MIITIEELLADRRESHSNLQIDLFILNVVGETSFGAYTQCLRELSSRHAMLQEFNGEPAWWRSLWLWMTRRTPTLEQVATTDRHRADVQREYDRFLMHARRLKTELGELTPAYRDELERHMWVHRFREMLWLDICSQGGPSHGTLEAIRKFPADMITEIVAGVPIPPPIVAWLKSAEAPRLPAITGGNNRLNERLALIEKE